MPDNSHTYHNIPRRHALLRLSSRTDNDYDEDSSRPHTNWLMTERRTQILPTHVQIHTHCWRDRVRTCGELLGIPLDDVPPDYGRFGVRRGQIPAIFVGTAASFAVLLACSRHIYVETLQFLLRLALFDDSVSMNSPRGTTSRPLFLACWSPPCCCCCVQEFHPLAIQATRIPPEVARKFRHTPTIPRAQLTPEPPGFQPTSRTPRSKISQNCRRGPPRTPRAHGPSARPSVIRGRVPT